MLQSITDISVRGLATSGCMVSRSADESPPANLRSLAVEARVLRLASGLITGFQSCARRLNEFVDQLESTYMLPTRYCATGENHCADTITHAELLELWISRVYPSCQAFAKPGDSGELQESFRRKAVKPQLCHVVFSQSSVTLHDVT